MKIKPSVSQPRSQVLSSSHTKGSGGGWGGEMKDPGNEVVLACLVPPTLTGMHSFITSPQSHCSKTSIVILPHKVSVFQLFRKRAHRLMLMLISESVKV